MKYPPKGYSLVESHSSLHLHVVSDLGSRTLCGRLIPDNWLPIPTEKHNEQQFACSVCRTKSEQIARARERDSVRPVARWAGSSPLLDRIRDQVKFAEERGFIAVSIDLPDVKALLEAVGG